MSSSEALYCPNPTCPQPENPVGNRFCDACQTPLLYRYLWAVGSAAAGYPIGELIGDRYRVVSPQIWLDTQPALAPFVPETLPEAILAYLQLYPHRLHIPEVYGFCPLGEGPNAPNLLLLDNVPVDGNTATLYPGMLELWPQTPPVRQVYWLWQILELWTPLLELGVASSLLKAENIRVQGSRVWLRELYGDASLITQPDLQDLGYHWLTWAGKVAAPVGDRLQEIGKQMRRPNADLKAVAPQVNQLLLELTAPLPMRLRVAGVSESGPNRHHNEDSCYPTLNDIAQTDKPHTHPLLNHLAIVCDGVGGHEGGEVASQLAVQALKLPIQALMREIAEEPGLAMPEVVSEQLEAILRVVNNTIAAQNDKQGRASRQRMGTTLVMTLQLPQKVTTPEGQELANAHELYVVQIGDSRAYWITPHYCQQLTVDDDVASREVRLGRAPYSQAVRRRDGGALTQALGTREGDLLRPQIQRFVLEEDGLLLLCSDGLSDNDRVEQFWSDCAHDLFSGAISVETAAQWWVDLANEKNGHDNVSVVLSYCRISPEKLVLFDPNQLPPTGLSEDELSDASKALLYDEEDEDPSQGRRRQSKGDRTGLTFPQTIALLVSVTLISAAIGFAAWWQIDSGGLTQLRERIFQQQE